MKHIETGVDKLVELVNKEKKIELHAAAKKLGLPADVIQEWADFLDEEGLITLEYKLSKIYLEERKLSKGEVEKKAKEYASKKDAFTRKVDTTLKKLESETAGFEEIKKQYYSLRDEIGEEIHQVKDEVEELQHYEDLKKSIDRDILQQKVDYEKSLNDIHKRVTKEEKNYEHVAQEVAKEAKQITQEKKELADLKQQESALNRRLEALKGLVTNISKQTNAEEKNLEHHEERLEHLLNLANKLETSIKEKREKEIHPLIESSNKHQQKILKIQDDIIQKIKSRKAEIEAYESQGEKIAKRFEKFFNKKAKTERVLLDLEKQKSAMKEELAELTKKAKTFDLAKDSSKHIKALEKKMSDYEKKHAQFAKKFVLLKELISGKKKQ